MRHRDYFQRIGLPVMLLAAGMLGGLLAPLPSEAAPGDAWISISVDASQGGFGSTLNEAIEFDAPFGNTVTGGVACSAADSVNYNLCYKIKTADQYVGGRVYGPLARRFQIENAVGTDGQPQDARLLINDCDGANCLEKMVLTGLRIVPVVPTGTNWDGSLVKVTLTYHNKFDFRPNDTTLGTAASSYRLPLSITGVFKKSTATVCSSQSAVGCPVNNEMHMWAKGIFCTSTDIASDCPNGTEGIGTPPLTRRMDSTVLPTGGGGNGANVDRDVCTVSQSPLCRMYFKVASTASSDARLDKAQQGVDYPGFRCNNGLTSTPTYNPLTNTIGSVSGKKCTADVTAFVEFKLYGADIVNLDGSPRLAGGNCGTKQAPSCDCTGKKQCLDKIIEQFVDGEVVKAKAVQEGIPDAIFCDPVTICNGTINNRIDVTPNPSSVLEFPFTAIGPDVSPFSISSLTSIADPFTGAFTGPGGTDRVIAPDYDPLKWPRPTPNNQNEPYYAVDQIHVTDANGNAVGPPFVEVRSCPGGNKGPVIIRDLRGTYNIRFHIHTSQQPGTLCQ